MKMFVAMVMAIIVMLVSHFAMPTRFFVRMSMAMLMVFRGIIFVVVM